MQNKVQFRWKFEIVKHTKLTEYFYIYCMKLVIMKIKLLNLNINNFILFIFWLEKRDIRLTRKSELRKCPWNALFAYLG